MLRYINLRTTAASCFLVVAALASGSALVAPASATSALKQLVSFACADAHACLTVVNSFSGKAIVGVSQTNHAIDGRITTAPPFNGTIFAGMRGDDAASSQTDYNAGVQGTAPNGTGVVGITSFDSSNSGLEQDGMVGLDNSRTINYNAGVLGASRKNAGLYGYATGVTIPSCTFLCPKSGVGVGAESGTGTGVFARGAIGVVALGDTRKFPALAVATSMSHGPLIEAFGSSDNTTEVMLLDHRGNLTVAGRLTQYGNSMTIRTTSHGEQVGIFAPQQSAPTMEDFGEAQLVEGRAVVQLDPRFASTLDTRFRYRVFLTPQGDSNGLYVAEKTASAFLVREHDTTTNGRSRQTSNVVLIIASSPSHTDRQRNVYRPTPESTMRRRAPACQLVSKQILSARGARLGFCPNVSQYPWNPTDAIGSAITERIGTNSCDSQPQLSAHFNAQLA